MVAPEGGVGPEVGASTPACSLFEERLDCLACGACCREAYDSVPVTEADEVLRVHPELIRRDGDWVDLQRVPSPTGCGTRCVALRGDGPFTCAIYAVRPQTCRDVEQGEAGCLFARRRVGLSADPR
jgi:Fe-S-cluster containining protein